jgi:hypothetical protein
METGNEIDEKLSSVERIDCEMKRTENDWGGISLSGFLEPCFI